jgi:predicted dehydrogenase
MKTTRRQFIQRSSGLLAGASLLPEVSALAPSRGDDALHVALVGCGGRGTSAATQALNTEGNVRLVAMADAFSDRLENSLAEIAKRHPQAVDVPEERRFVGFDAYRKAIDEDVDVVVLTTPPGFRPIHFDYAVSKARHVFMEKPVAVDAPGVRSVLATAKRAKEKNLKVGVGLQRHHDPRYQETIRRIQDGAIGKIILLRSYWNSGGVWVRPREEGMGEMEYQMRNWYYFNWLCGDHIVEQHIHNLDVANWIMGGYPATAQGQGGRQVRKGPAHGEIYDHHAVEFTYADGTKLLSQCRHQSNCWSSVSEHAHGTQGYSEVSAATIEGEGGWKWRYEGERPDPYQVEHDRLFAAIRADEPHAEAEYGALSTMTSIFGRMATYSGQKLNWKDALNSEISIAPTRYAFDADPPTLPDTEGIYPVPVPGVTKVL